MAARMTASERGTLPWNAGCPFTVTVTGASRFTNASLSRRAVPLGASPVSAMAWPVTVATSFCPGLADSAGTCSQ